MSSNSNSTSSSCASNGQHAHGQHPHLYRSTSLATGGAADQPVSPGPGSPGTVFDPFSLDYLHAAHQLSQSALNECPIHSPYASNPYPQHGAGHLYHGSNHHYGHHGQHQNTPIVSPPYMHSNSLSALVASNGTPAGNRPRSRSGSTGPGSTMARVLDIFRGRSHSIAATPSGVDAQCLCGVSSDRTLVRIHQHTTLSVLPLACKPECVPPCRIHSTLLE